MKITAGGTVGEKVLFVGSNYPRCDEFTVYVRYTNQQSYPGGGAKRGDSLTTQVGRSYTCRRRAIEAVLAAVREQPDVKTSERMDAPWMDRKSPCDCPECP